MNLQSWMDHELTSDQFDKKDDTLSDKIHKADFSAVVK
jgi:hypothetical protein